MTFYYEDMVRSGIRALKFSGRSARARVFSPYLVQTIAEELGGEFDAVTYVPISAQRRFRRGYDQTQLLAKHVAAAWGITAEQTLRKTRNNPPQSLIRTLRERQENVQNVYALRERADIAQRRFLLIDDITTSGSTLIVCADLLLAGGASSVVCAALAGGHPEEKP
ncbi:MAG: ComF family protein [Oscillospiraceae bacterium]|nr:ComF family protein [Oscillospiraceae bacterium]